MEEQREITCNNTGVSIRRHLSDYVISVADIIKALGIENKTPYDLLRHGIPKDSIVVIPLTKRVNVYYLKREGIKAFFQKYKPEELQNFLDQYDILVQQATEKQKSEEQDVQNKIKQLGDPLVVDLLEDILRKVNESNKEAKKFYDAAVTMYSRQMVFMIEMESLYSKVAAILLKAESLGPVTRLNKELARDIIALGKDCFSDAMACEQMLKEYENFGRDEEVTQSDETDNSDNPKTSGLLIRTDKKDKNSGKKH